MTAFLAEPPKTPVVVTGKTQKKRKRDKPYSRSGDKELQDMRAKAKSMCKSFEQYRSVSRYKKDRLRDWLDQKEFDSDAQLLETVFTFAHQVFSTAVDFITKGEGFVKERLCNDLTLRAAIEDEGRDAVKWLSNKSKIAFLTCSDTFEGKMEQREKVKSEVTVEDVTDEQPEAEDATEGDDEATDNVPDVVGEADTAAQEHEVVTLPSDIEGEATRDDTRRPEGVGKNTSCSENAEE